MIKQIKEELENRRKIIIEITKKEREMAFYRRKAEEAAVVSCELAK